MLCEIIFVHTLLYLSILTNHIQEYITTWLQGHLEVILAIPRSQLAVRMALIGHMTVNSDINEYLQIILILNSTKLYDCL